MVKNWLKSQLWNYGKPTLKRRAAYKKAAQLLEARSEISLELGAGAVEGKNGWITIDKCEGADLNWDFHERLPFPDNSVVRIYSSHVLEHFFYRDLVDLLTDCYRVLKPGGLFSACVPDASIYVRGYVDRKNFDRTFLTYTPAFISDLKMDWINYIAYMDGNHRFMFDEENLHRVLLEAGFVDVRRRDFDPALDLIERKYESIYAVAIKPRWRP